MNKRQNPTDRFLIQQYRKGNTSLLPVLVKRYHKVFCEKSYWVTKDKEIAKDVAQESWIVIINKLDSLENPDSFKSWALRIIYTKSIDAVKRRNKERKNLDSTVHRGCKRVMKQFPILYMYMLLFNTHSLQSTCCHCLSGTL